MFSYFEVSTIDVWSTTHVNMLGFIAPRKVVCTVEGRRAGGPIHGWRMVSFFILRGVLAVAVVYPNSLLRGYLAIGRQRLLHVVHATSDRPEFEVIWLFTNLLPRRKLVYKLFVFKEMFRSNPSYFPINCGMSVNLPIFKWSSSNIYVQ